jgi:endonuclease III-like uncharacterized protein
MTNREIIEKIYKLQMIVRTKNATVANALEKSTLHLLEYSKPLEGASKSELLKIKGVGPGTVEYILSISEGKSVFEVSKNITKPKNGRIGEVKWKW